MANKKQQSEDEGIQNLDDQQRTFYLDNRAKLNEAWKEIDDLKVKITKLDIEVANLKDVNNNLEQTKQNLFTNFQTLYNMHEELLNTVTNATIATNITQGHLAQAITKYKFIIPEAPQN